MEKFMEASVRRQHSIKLKSEHGSRGKDLGQERMIS